MKKITRREFVISLAALPVVGSFFFCRFSFGAEGLPAGKNAASESDPMATALGYKHDFAQVDKKKYAQLSKPENKSQRCASCNFYKPENGSWGSCQLIKSGLVNANGWCASWVKKG
jgi:hypothetical protein